MKRLFFVAGIIGILASSCRTDKSSSTTTATFHPYETIMDGNVKILKGLLHRSDIVNDPSFKWFAQNYALGQPDAAAVAAFKQNGSKFQMLVFGGTWCEDTQNLLPQFFRLVDASGYSEDNITLVGVDRKKTTLNNLNSTFHITNVPTFIVLKDGKEIGRVIEYGKYGQMDKDLGEIISGL